MAVVGIDLGTQSTKAAVVGLDGRPLAEASVPVALRRPRAGWAEQDAEVLVTSTLTAVREAVVRAPRGTRVAAIGLAGQIGGAIGVDAAFEPVTHHEAWLDTRADDDRAAVLAEAGDEILAANGIIPFVGPRVRRWLREDPQLRGRLACVVAPVGYVAGRLTGATAQDAVCDRVQANLYGCFDNRTQEWDERLAEVVGIPAALLPRVVEPEATVGGLTPALADATGLAAGTPFVAGLGDGMAGMLAAGAVRPGVCVDTAGSSDHFSVTVPRFSPDLTGTLTCMPAAARGLWHLMGFTIGTGLAQRWSVEALAGGDWEAAQRQAAAAAPGAGGLAVPHFHGRVSPFDPHVKGAFVGFDETATPGSFHRALLESVAMEFRGWIASARRLLPDVAVERLAGVGGGARSDLGMRIKADALGAPYVRMKPFVNAARGAALVAATGEGVALDDPRWHHEELVGETRFDPDPSVAADYERLFARYRVLSERLAALYAELAEAR